AERQRRGARGPPSIGSPRELKCGLGFALRFIDQSEERGCPADESAVIPDLIGESDLVREAQSFRRVRPRRNESILEDLREGEAREADDKRGHSSVPSSALGLSPREGARTRLVTALQCAASGPLQAV